MKFVRGQITTVDVIPNEPAITPELVVAHGRKPGEYARIIGLTGGVTALLWCDDGNFASPLEGKANRRSTCSADWRVVLLITARENRPSSPTLPLKGGGSTHR